MATMVVETSHNVMLHEICLPF